MPGFNLRAAIMIASTGSRAADMISPVSLRCTIQMSIVLVLFLLFAIIHSHYGLNSPDLLVNLVFQRSSGNKDFSVASPKIIALRVTHFADKVKKTLSVHFHR